MFWGLIMEPKRRYFQKVTRAFHISMASMDVLACTKEPVQLMVQFQKRNYLLCTLLENGPTQVSLDLNFEVGDEVSFTINGHSRVHLSGYHVDDEFEEHEDGDEVDVKEVVEKNEDVSPSNIIYGKRKHAKSSAAMIVTYRESTGLAEMIGNNLETLKSFPAAKRSKTLQLLEDADESDDDDDEDVTFSDLDDSSDEADTTLDVADVDSDDDDADVDDVDLDDSDEDDDSQLEEGEGEEAEESEDEDEGEQEEDEQESEEEMKNLLATKEQLKMEKNKEKQQQKQVQQQIPVKQKQEYKKDKQQQQQQEQVNGTPPVSDKKKKRKRNKNQTQNESFGEDVNTSGRQNKKSPKNEKRQQQNPQNSPQKIFVDRGVSIEEIVVGAGNPVKNGKFAHVYYEGRLKNNKKTFDSCLKGRPPFKFRLGANEVIKGWDIGVAGMKIGGKRRITVPANLAYGSQGNKPVIPPNATLVFDIELANAN